MRLKEPISSAISLLKETWREFNEDNGTLIAAAISFYMFLSIFPLLMAAVGILGLIFGSPAAKSEDIILAITKNYTVGTQVRELIAQVIRGGSAATGVGILLLLWSGIKVVSVLENAMNVAFEVEEQRSFLKKRAIALLYFIIMSILFLILVGVSGLAGYLRARGFGEWSWLSTFLSYLIPLVVISTVLTLVYKLLPNKHVKWCAALYGGAFAGVLWAVALQVFTFYVIHFASYNQVYGSLGAVILLMVWINYSASVAILGAELASIVQQWDETRVH